MQKLTPQEAAEYMRMSLRTFNRQVRPGVQRIRIGRKVFYQTEDLDAFATECTVQPISGRRRTRSRFLEQARKLPPLNVRGA